MVYKAYVLILVLLGTPISAQESDSFRIRSLSVTALADVTTSAGYRSTVVATEIHGAVGVCPTGPAATLGALSYRGAQAIPNVLTVDKIRDGSGGIDLTWTGQAAEFAIYRSPSPEHVSLPENQLATTAVCSSTDGDITGSRIDFYVVVPSAP